MSVTLDVSSKSSVATGAAKKKRGQLRRKGVRLGVTEKYFVNQYRDKKDEKKRMRQTWYEIGGTDEDMPDEYRKAKPAMHPPQKKSRWQDQSNLGTSYGEVLITDHAVLGKTKSPLRNN